MLTTPSKDPSKAKFWEDVRIALLKALPEVFHSGLNWPEAIRAIENNLDARPVCKTCSGPVKFYTGNGGHYARFCSAKCGQLNSEVQDKLKNTLKHRYGVTSIFSLDSSKEASKNSRNRIKNETGHWPGSSSRRPLQDRLSSAKKAQETRRSNIAVGNVKPLQEAKRCAIIETLGDKWGSPLFGERGRLLSITHICGAVQFLPRKSKSGFRCFECEAPRKAQLQWEFEQELKSILPNVVFIRNFRLPSKKQIDLYCQERKIGIEINGLYWHSEASKTQDPMYHQQKFLEAKDNGIRLITIWEDQIKEKREQIFNRLKSTFDPKKINARSCEVVDVSAAQAKEFLDKYHLDGYLAGSAIGLTFDNELVLVATYGKSRFGKDRSKTEILRLATAGNLQIRGGLSKIISHLRKNIQGPLMSYASTDWGGGGYAHAGGKLLKLTSPGYFYFNKKTGTRHHRLGFSKSSFEKTTGVKYNTGLTEYENAELLGFFRTFNGGSWLYEWV